VGRFRRPFLECGEAQRAQVLDDVAWPARARPEHADAAAFFSRLRDLTASAFFSSAMGVEDLRYQGNVFNPEWRGAPQQALDELGVSYEEWDRRYGGLQ
jgi:gluconate 2-dehydrogenase gamma chain